MIRCIFRAMSFRARITLPLVFLPFLTQCGTGSAPSTNAVTGPFDSRGNYVEEWADSPEKWHRPSAPSSPSSRPKPTYERRDPAPPQIAAVERRPSPTVSAPKPKPKPKPVVVKLKPKQVKYTVKKGDSLSRIASKHSIGLSSLRRANGISGDLIRPGQVLTIPR
jgi:nucleoid-associated protein YgaU